MLYQLFTWLNQEFNLPGAGMFQFLTFRIAMAVLLSLIIATVFGKKLIEFLQKLLESLVYKASSKKRVHQPWVVSLFC
jgi:hypothetical protein